MKKVKMILAAALVFTGVMAPVTGAYAENEFSKDICGTDIDADLKEAAGCNENRQAMSVANSLLNIVLTVTGLLSVVFVIVGGVRYQVSAGDAGKAKAAKDTITYAIIGLIVSMLAFAIVNFLFGAFGE